MQPHLRSAGSHNEQAAVGPVPARYVRHSQMCPQLDVSDKNVQKTQDISDKARFVRHKLKNRRVCPTKILCVLLAFS